MLAKNITGFAGFVLFVGSGTLIIMHDIVVTCMLSGDRAFQFLVAAVHPDAVQPWVSLVNAAMITIGTTLIMLRQRWIRVDAEEKAATVQKQVDETRKDVDERHDRDLADRQQIRQQVCEIQKRLDHAYRLIGLYRAVVSIDREWITRVSVKHHEPLPHDFGQREFDPITEEDKVPLPANRDDVAMRDDTPGPLDAHRHGCPAPHPLQHPNTSPRDPSDS